MAFKLYDVIEYESSDNLLVYKHPCEDFNTKTKLVVREGQIAVFVKNGTIADTFSAGRYKLSTENIPIIRHIMAIPTGGECSFTSEVYFFNSTNLMNVKWGTQTPMELEDPKYHVIVRVGASGDSMFRIVDGGKFLKRIIGQNVDITAEDLARFFRSLINTYIRNAVSDCLVVQNIPITSINSCLLSISKSCNDYINKKLEEYGLSVENLMLENIHIPDNDEGLSKLKAALNKRAEMNLLGYTYQEERTFDVMQASAKNSGGASGSLSNLGLGIGVAMGIGRQANQMVDKLSVGTMQGAQPSPVSAPVPQQTLESVQPTEPMNFCPGCGMKLQEGYQFCPGCGRKR